MSDVKNSTKSDGKSKAKPVEAARVYLGWDRPLLVSTVERLAERYARGNQWNLEHVVVVLPVHRAIKRLSALLGEHAREHSLRLTPPRLATVGSLPEMLYEPSRPIASELQQTLAWTKTLSSLADDQLHPLMPTVPPREPISPWVEMASTLRRLCEDLAADAIAPSDVVDHVQGETEQGRWRLIARLYQQYVETLAATGLSDPYHERRTAIAEGRCAAPHDLVLVGCVDLGAQTCQMISAVAKRVTLYIGAPEDQARLFDACGRVDPAVWRETHVEIADEDLVAAGDAEHQCALAAEMVDRWRRNDESARVTVGVTEESFAPLVETELALCGIQPLLVAGVPVARTAPGRLMELMRDLLASPTWYALSALMRHATVLGAMCGEHGSMRVLTELDQLRSTHFPVRLDDSLPEAADPRQYPALAEARMRVLEWLQPMLGRSRRFSDWCARLREVLGGLYGMPTLRVPQDVAEVQSAAVAEIDGLLQRFAELPRALDIRVTAQVAIDMVLGRLADPRMVVRGEASPVEVSGWLDLAMDDAPAMVVVGFNHPFVPQAVTADPFLPGNLRSRLRVADNERRFARDAYVLQLIQSTRQSRAMIVGRYGADGSPTPPSRLLSACPSQVTLRRIRRLLDDTEAKEREVGSVAEGDGAGAGCTLRNRWHRESDSTDLPIPAPDSSCTVRSISVTAFRAYLECPYRFYLRHVLGLRPLDDATGELAANQFGDLIHGAVEAFGLSANRCADDADEVAESMIAELRAYAETHYGANPTAAVRVQIAQAEKRLRVVAEAQAQWVRQGWQIHSVEAAVEESHGAAIELPDGRRLLLKGRVDRIDYHPVTGRWAILDYKTHGKKPLEKHYEQSTGRWIDLQLPLYLKMLEALGIQAGYDQVDVGYFNIASKPEETGIHLAEWTPSLLESAFRRAEDVARGVLDGRFDLDPEAPPVDYDDYAAIVQTGVAENLLIELED